jgi:hypothetical protein
VDEAKAPATAGGTAAETEGFQRVEGGKEDVQADFSAVVAAYGLIAAVWVAFLLLIWRKLGQADQQALRVEGALKKLRAP